VEVVGSSIDAIIGVYGDSDCKDNLDIGRTHSMKWYTHDMNGNEVERSFPLWPGPSALEFALKRLIWLCNNADHKVNDGIEVDIIRRERWLETHPIAPCII